MKRNYQVQVSHSIFSETDILDKLFASQYSIGKDLRCNLYKVGENDTYLIQSEQDKYILRIYRAKRPWREQSIDEIKYELELLTYLKSKNISVSVPIPQKDNTLISEIKSPEGLRYAVLFNFVDGKVPRMDSLDSFIYGQSVAQLYNGMEGFISQKRRAKQDIDSLLNAPVERIQMILPRESNEIKYFTNIRRRLSEYIQNLPVDQLEQGICHGDLFWQNVHFSADNHVNFFDFDNCGEGWRAYDLAMISWAAERIGKGKDVWKNFLAGYCKERDIKKVDLIAVNVFGALWQIRFMASRNLYEWSLDQDLWLKFLSEWIENRVFDKL